MHSKVGRFLTAYLLITAILASSTAPTKAVSTQPKDLSPYAPANEAFGQPPSGQWLYFPFPFDASVNDIWVDDHGGVWLATSNGLVLFNGEEFTMFFEGLDLQTVGGDNEGNLVATNSFGRAHFFKESTFETYDQIQVVPESAMETIPQIQSVLVDSEGNTWFACFYQGLAKYDGRQLDWIQSELPFGDFYVDLAEDQDGMVWVCVAADSGVAAYRRDAGWEVHNQETGMIDDDCLAISIDQQGNLWELDDTPWVMMFDGTAWTLAFGGVDTPGWSRTDCGPWSHSFSDIWGYTPNNVWIAASQSGLLFYDHDGESLWFVVRGARGWGFVSSETYFTGQHIGGGSYVSSVSGDQQGVLYARILDSESKQGLLVFVPTGAELRHYTPPSLAGEEPEISLEALLTEKEKSLIPALKSPSGIQFLDFPIPAPGYDETGAQEIVAHLRNQHQQRESGNLTIEAQDALDRQTAAFQRFVCQEDIMAKVYPHYASVSSDVVHPILEIAFVVLSFSKACEELIYKISEDIPYVRQLMIKQNQKLFDTIDSLHKVTGHWIEDAQDREAWDRAWTALFMVVRAGVSNAKGIADMMQDTSEIVGTEIVLARYVNSTQGTLDSGAQRVWNSSSQQFFEGSVRGPASTTNNEVNRIVSDAKMHAHNVREMREGLDGWADWAGLMGDVGSLLQANCPPCAIVSVVERVGEVFARIYELLWVGFPAISSLRDLPYAAEQYCFDTTTLYGAKVSSHIDYAQARSMQLSCTTINQETAQYLTRQSQTLQQAISDYQKVQRQVVEALQRNDTEAVTNLIPDLMKAEDALAAQFRVSRDPILASVAHLRDTDSTKYKQVGYDALNYDGQVSIFYAQLTDYLVRPESIESCQVAISQAEEVDQAILAYQQSIEALESTVALVLLPPSVLLAGYSVEGLHVDLEVVNASPAIAHDVMVTLESVAPVAAGDLAGGETKPVSFNVQTPGLYSARVEAENSEPDTLFVWISASSGEATTSPVRKAGNVHEFATNVLLGIGGLSLCASVLLGLAALWMRKGAKRRD